MTKDVQHQGVLRRKAYERFSSDRQICFQRAIKEIYAEAEGDEQAHGFGAASVVSITKEAAESVILKYEWLGTLGQARAFYGLIIDGTLAGVTCFGLPGGAQSRDVCGKQMREKSMCLIRGACTHVAPKNSASFLISRACAQAHIDYGWSIFYAYADPAAGEIGNVYQATNWYYLGQGIGRTPGRLREEWILSDGKQVSSRYLRHRNMKIKDALKLGWKRVFTLPKHKYVWFEGNRRERRYLISLCRYPFLEYPKDRFRPEVAPLFGKQGPSAEVWPEEDGNG